MEAYCKGGQGPPRAVAPPKKKTVIIKYETVKEEIKYLKLGKYCVAFPGVIPENTFIKSVSCWGVS